MNPAVHLLTPHFGGGVGGIDAHRPAIGLGQQRHHQVSLGVADQVFHDSFGLRVLGVTKVRGEPVMGGQADVVRGGHHHVGDDAALQAGHSVGQQLAGHSADLV